MERSTEVGPGKPLDGNYSIGVLIRRFGRIVAGNTAEPVFRTEQSHQTLRAGAQEVCIRAPVCTIRKGGINILITHNHKSR